MDPVSAVIGILVVIHLAKNLPDAIADLAAAARASWDNAANKERLRKLAQAGVKAAGGGPARQYLGNLWRGAWLDAQKRRDAKRAGSGAGDRSRSPVGRLRGWWAGRVDAAADRFRSRYQAGPAAGDEPAGPPIVAQATVGRGPAIGAGNGAGDGGPAGPIVADATVDRAPAPPPAPRQAVDDQGPDELVEGELVSVGAAVAAAPVAVGAGAAGAIQSAQPTSAGGPAQIEGGTVTGQAVEVTGVQAGVAEAAAIRAEVLAATENYNAHLQRIRNRISNLYASAYANIQLGAHSAVLQELNEANSALASAQGFANKVGAEVMGFVHRVWAAFVRII